MPTQDSVQAAIDQATTAAFAGHQLVKGNTDYESLSKGNQPFTRQTVNFFANSQFALGNTDRGRVKGAVFFVIHVKKGTGNGHRNTLEMLISSTFRNKIIGGATFFSVRMINLGEEGTWAKTAVEIPFHFEGPP